MEEKSLGSCYQCQALSLNFTNKTSTFNFTLLKYAANFNFTIYLHTLTSIFIFRTQVLNENLDIAK